MFHVHEEIPPRELVSQDQFGVRLHTCPRCHTDLTDAIRAHLYSCAMLPAEVRRRAQAARDTARSLVKRSLELRDAADVAMREAEAAIQSLRETLRKAPTRIASKDLGRHSSMGGPPGRSLSA